MSKINVIIQKVSKLSRLYDAAHDAYYTDSFAIRSDKLNEPIEELYARLMSKTPKWFDSLMKLRDSIAQKLGLNATKDIAKQLTPFEVAHDKFAMNNQTKPNKIMDFFEVYELNQHEIIFGIKDKHLSLKGSLLRIVAGDGQSCKLVMSNIIHTHNIWGKIYLFFILPTHKIIIKKMLQNAHKRGDI